MSVLANIFDSHKKFLNAERPVPRHLGTERQICHFFL